MKAAIRATLALAAAVAFAGAVFAPNIPLCVSLALMSCIFGACAFRLPEEHQ